MTEVSICDNERFQTFRAKLNEHGYGLRAMWSSKRHPDGKRDDVAMFQVFSTTGHAAKVGTLIAVSYGEDGFGLYPESPMIQVEADVQAVIHGYLAILPDQHAKPAMTLEFAQDIADLAEAGAALRWPRETIHEAFWTLDRHLMSEALTVETLCLTHRRAQAIWTYVGKTTNGR